jgi:hypothetical protein
MHQQRKMHQQQQEASDVASLSTGLSSSSSQHTLDMPAPEGESIPNLAATPIIGMDGSGASSAPANEAEQESFYGDHGAEAVTTQRSLPGPSTKLRRCGAQGLSMAERAEVSRRIKEYRAAQGTPSGVAGATAAAAAMFKPLVVPTYFHVITNGSAAGNLSDSTIAAQMRVLNEGFANTSISFQLVQTRRYVDRVVFSSEEESQEEVAFKTRNRNGTASSLNIYSRRLPNFLGYAFFPSRFVDFPKEDAVFIHYNTVPGGAFIGANLGLTLTHEVSEDTMHAMGV